MSSPDLLETLLERRVLIVGDLMLDEYLWGQAARLSPEAPVPVVEVRSRTCCLGGAANVAANIASLGGIPLLAGCVGHDRQGEQLKQMLEQRNVDTHGLIATPERATTTKSRLLAQGQQVVRMDSECRLPLAREAERALLGWVESHLPQAEACILSDYGKGVVTGPLAEQLVRGARRRALPVVVDPKGTSYEKYRGATVIKPNVHEVERLLETEIATEAALEAAGLRLAAVLEGSAVLVTRGADGMSLFRSGMPPLHIPAIAKRVFDVTGAGDTVVAALGLVLAGGGTLKQALMQANRAASIVVGKRGTATATLQELREAAAQASQ